jgi:hypothetical protein
MLLILAMTQPVLHLPSSAVSIAYVLDVSKSISPSSLQESIEWIRRTNTAGNPSHSRFIAFAANSKSFDRIEDLTQVAVSATSKCQCDQSEPDEYLSGIGTGAARV